MVSSLYRGSFLCPQVESLQRYLLQEDKAVAELQLEDALNHGKELCSADECHGQQRFNIHSVCLYNIQDSKTFDLTGVRVQGRLMKFRTRTAFCWTSAASRCVSTWWPGGIGRWKVANTVVGFTSCHSSTVLGGSFQKSEVSLTCA